MKLYGYFRSSAAYRVRIALNLKGLRAATVPVNLRLQEHTQPTFRTLSAAGLVPALEYDGKLYSQSLAIIEFLDEIAPHPPLLPKTPADRAFVRAVALSVACDIHPLNNLRVLNYLKDRLHLETMQRDQWYAHWIHVGLEALETMLARDARVGAFCYGDTPGLADICLIPQVYNAERMHCDLTAYPTLRRIAAQALSLAAFQEAAPERQADAAP